jgi:hypothetical protein
VDLKIPTSEEILQAGREIESDGPAAPTTLALSRMAVLDPRLREIVRRMAAGLNMLSREAGVDLPAAIEGAITGGMVSGFNLGLRIAAARAKAEHAELLAACVTVRDYFMGLEDALEPVIRAAIAKAGKQ